MTIAPAPDERVHVLLTDGTTVCVRPAGGRPLPRPRSRARPPGLERLLPRLSRMADGLPQLAEADLNPVLATPDRVTALDARVRLPPRRARGPCLRRLR